MSQGMLGVSVHEARGVVADLFEKLGGPNGREWLVALKRFLRREEPWDSDKSTTFPIWRTITLGDCKNVKDIRECLKKQRVYLGDRASSLMDQPGFALAAEKMNIDLVVLSVADLGFPKGATYGEICGKAKEMRLNLCPAEVGPALLYQYLDQPADELLVIASELIAGSDGHLHLFWVGDDRGGDRRLSTYWSYPADFWNPGYQFVFSVK